AFARSILNNEPDAEDVVINVFMRLWQNRKTMASIKNISAYLYTAAKYASINVLKSRKQISNIDIDDLADTFQYSFATPETALIDRENIKQLEDLLNTLPPKSRLVFYLVKDKGLTCKEVSVLLNTSVRTVETQLYQTVRKITTWLSSKNIHLKRKSGNS
ncbi:sigma-70 family RNA polymerase sigma factor, partial [Spirosoma sp.]|uniref:sigma-70 family RNA polymerase sigma factor n=1 Tax=Spirosoma sp. TaxID=1899569 RepID=UPI003B3A8E00